MSLGRSESGISTGSLRSRPNARRTFQDALLTAGTGFDPLRFCR